MSIVVDILQYGTGSHLTSSEAANAVATDFVTPGVVGTLSNTNGIAPATGGFAVNAQGSPDTTVAISAGVMYVTGTPTSQGSQTLRVKNSAVTSATIAANSTGSTKYDHVYTKLDPTNLANPNTAADNVATIVTSRSSSASVDDGTPPTYGFKLAVVTVANGFSTITNANISDRRTQAGVTAVAASAATSSWTALGYTPSSVTANGNRSYSLLFTASDLTSTLTPGMRLRTTNTVAAPTRCTSLNGSTQYYSKSSPAGMTFTDDFAVSVWVKITSYSSTGMVMSRYNGTSGWNLNIQGTGAVVLQANNASSANYSLIQSYQSIPLNRWVHIAAQLDMSTFTNTSTSSYIMINGVNVPASVQRAGTNPTALIQAGNLEVGSWNGGLLPFAGKIAQAAVFSAKVTQATMLTYMSQGLAGTETSLISAYSFDNSINDLNANANNLTANGAAVATNADSPFGGQADGTISSTLNYGIVQSATYSTDTTVVVQVPEGCTIPTSGGVSSVVYSTQATPFNFPASAGKWSLICFSTTNVDITPSTSWATLTLNMGVPIGAWQLKASPSWNVTHIAGTVGAIGYISLSSSTSSESNPLLSTQQFSDGEGTAAVGQGYTSWAEDYVLLAAFTTFTVIGKVSSATNITDLQINQTNTGTTLIAQNAYL